MPWESGWDSQCGGFYYFLDTAGESPTQLEWSMKLWWVHCEGLIASLMAYRVTGYSKHWLMFKHVFDYISSHVSIHRHLVKLVLSTSFLIQNMESGLVT